MAESQVERVTMARTYRMSPGRRIVNALVKALLRLRLPSGYALLTVRGRRTGRAYTTPVRPVDHAGDQWLVAPYGPVGWVRNARASGGEVILTTRGRSRRVRLVETDPERAAPVLRRYVGLVPVTRPFFDAGPDDPEDHFAAGAADHPVFRVVEPAIH
jgi:deazaflavin-dependent oxidoreductase (nitroreductase family)